MSDRCKECQLHREMHYRLDAILMIADTFDVIHEGGQREAWENTLAAVEKLAAKPAPSAFYHLDHYWVVTNKGVPVQGEFNADAAFRVAEAMNQHNERAGQPTRYRVVRVEALDASGTNLGVASLEEVCNKLVEDWDAEGRMPGMSWDFRGFAADAIRRGFRAGLAKRLISEVVAESASPNN